MRKPNICFNQDYCPVLIDFDFAEESKETTEDFKIFIDDVIKHLCPLKSFTKDELKKDEFLMKLDKTLLECSLVKKYDKTIQSVIEARVQL